MRSSSRLLLSVTLVVVCLLAAAWLCQSMGGLHDRLAVLSPRLASGLIAALVTALLVMGAVGVRLVWKLSRGDHAPTAQAPEDLLEAAQEQAKQARQVLEQVADPTARDDLASRLEGVFNEQRKSQFRVVVFGTGSAGKTSLINALLGRQVGRTEAVMGTTRHGELHEHRQSGVDGTLIVTDTPGMLEAGEGGLWRETEARELATRADLLLFVVDHDLTRSEFEPLKELARLGKRSIVVLNKKDRFPPDDLTAILAKLRERLTGIVPPADIVAIAAAPRPGRIRERQADGTIREVLEPAKPELSALDASIKRILRAEGETLRAGNQLLEANAVAQAARDQLTAERRLKAEAIIDRFQWITASTVFANPLPVLDLLATGTIQVQMITEIAAAYGLELSTSHARTILQRVAQTLLKLGLVEAASSLVAGAIKSSVVGFAAGGAIQATTMAYLTHVSGHAFLEYFEHGQSWGDAGMQAALERQFEMSRRTDFLREFASQAIRHLGARLTDPSPKMTKGNRS